MRTARERQKQIEKERFIVYPPTESSKHRTSFHATIEEAREKAFLVASESLGERTEIVERTPSGYQEVGYYDYYGMWHLKGD